MALSVVIITLNEAVIIEKTLQALQGLGEIIVVDSGSTDKTVEICEQYGCLVFYKKFEGYGTQKKFAVSKATNEWILSIDADEIVTTALKEEIAALIKQKETFVNVEKDTAVAYNLQRSLIFMHRKLRFGGEYRNKQLRLFSKKFANFNDLQVHEFVEVQRGKIETLQGELLHYSYRDIEDYFKKFNRYTSLAAAELYAKRKHKPLIVSILRLPLDFAYKYFVRGLVFDGFAGFCWALFSSFYPIVKYAKLQEMYETEQQNYRNKT